MKKMKTFFKYVCIFKIHMENLEKFPTSHLVFSYSENQLMQVTMNPSLQTSLCVTETTSTVCVKTENL